MAMGRNIVSSLPTPDKLNPDLLQSLHGIKSGSALPQRRQALSGGRRSDGRLPGGERRGAGPATDRREPKAASGGCRSWNDAWTERKHERRKVADHR
jgi:hypothetical protein